MRTISATGTPAPDVTTAVHWRTITASPRKPGPMLASVRRIHQQRAVAWVGCPEGTRAAAPDQLRIRSVERGRDRVIGGEATTNCLVADREEDAPLPKWIRRKVVARKRGKAPRSLPENDPNTRVCVERAADALGVRTTPLYLILDVEGGTLGETSPNANGSYDMGPAQINSSWLPKFASRGISEAAITGDLCTNVMAAAWIYAQGLQATGDMAKAIALYHSPTRRHQQRYLGKIGEAIDKRLLQLGPSPQPRK